MNCSVSICKNPINITPYTKSCANPNVTVKSFGRKSGCALKTHFLRSPINKSSEIQFPTEKGILNHFDKEPKLGLKRRGKLGPCN